MTDFLLDTTKFGCSLGHATCSQLVWNSSGLKLFFPVDQIGIAGTASLNFTGAGGDAMSLTLDLYGWGLGSYTDKDLTNPSESTAGFIGYRVAPVPGTIIGVAPRFRIGGGGGISASEGLNDSKAQVNRGLLSPRPPRAEVLALRIQNVSPRGRWRVPPQLAFSRVA